MAVFRIEKTKDYTTMSNRHFKDSNLSLKAKGLLSLMLSLPDEWDYTVKGLSMICKDGIDSINNAIKELETYGYIQRTRIRNAKGQLTTVEYTIREKPTDVVKENAKDEDKEETKDPILHKPILEKPILENPIQVNPIQDKPTLVTPIQENHHQLNTKVLSIKALSTNGESTDALNPNQSYQSKDRYDEIEKSNTQVPYHHLQNMVKKNISYDHFMSYLPSNRVGLLNNFVELIVEVLMSNAPTISISGTNHHTEYVKERFMQINETHIEYVFSCLNEYTPNIRNIKKYLLTTLFNATMTLDSYYVTQVNYDLKQSEE